jgi:putative methyltransferase (TIGR04325 family)
MSSTGYDSTKIHESVLKAALAVKSGDALYERDSMLFYTPSFDWPVISAILIAAMEKNKSLNVMDYGGSLGSSYYQNIRFLKSMNSFHWCVVEQAHFVDSGNQYLADEYLHFYASVEESAADYPPDLIVLSSVLQYLENPFLLLDKLKKINAKYMLISRTPFVENNKDIFAVQNVPDNLYRASYPIRLFGQESFMKSVLKDWNVVVDGEKDEGDIQNNLPFTLLYKWILLVKK